MKTKLLFAFLFLILLSFSSQAQWKDANFPYGSSTTCIAQNGNHLFVGTFTHIYHSTDKGANWSAVKLHPSGEYIYNLTVQNNIVYAGTSRGLIKTEDNGTTWLAVSKTGLTDTVIKTFAFKGSKMLVGTYRGVFSSIDNGNTWVAAGNQFGLSKEIESMTICGNDILVGITRRQGIYRSSDEGNNWERVDTLSVPAGIYGNALASKGDTVYTAGLSDGYVSIDKGSHWKQLGIVSTNNSAEIFSFRVIPGIVYACTTNGVYRSLNNGASWTALNNGIPAKENFYKLITDKNEFFLSSRKGVFYSNNSGASWKAINKGLTLREVTSLTTLGNKVFATTWSDSIYTSENNNLSWKETKIGIIPPAYISSVSAYHDTVYAVAYLQNIVFISTDNGITWKQKKGNFSPWALDICKVGNRLFWGTTAGIYRSDNNGDTWNKVVDPLIRDASVYAIISSGNNIYLSIENEFIYSRDKGDTWNFSNSQPGGYIYTLFQNGNRLFAGTSTNIAYSDDQGVSWVQAKNGLPKELYPKEFAAKGNVVFTVGLKGVFVSFNNGVDWSELSYGLILDQAETVTILDDYVYVGLWVSGLWYRKISDIAVDVKAQTLTPSCVVYPNPTAGRFSISSLTGGNELKITNALGEEVYVTTTTNSSLQIDLGGLAKGIYFISITSKEGKTQNKKIIIQ